MELFEKFAKQESNENTALILMLGVVNKNIERIIDILKDKKGKNNGN